MHITEVFLMSIHNILFCGGIKFYETVFKLQIRHEYMTKITIYHVHNAITPKEGKIQLCFLCSACHLMVVNIL